VFVDLNKSGCSSRDQSLSLVKQEKVLFIFFPEDRNGSKDRILNKKTKCTTDFESRGFFEYIFAKSWFKTSNNL
jgi:hypothetical protein